jgi:hypothetical protein
MKKKLNLNKLATEITLLEGKKVQVSRGQAKEVLKWAMLRFSAYPPWEVLEAIDRTAKKYKYLEKE